MKLTKCDRKKRECHYLLQFYPNYEEFNSIRDGTMDPVKAEQFHEAFRVLGVCYEELEALHKEEQKKEAKKQEKSKRKLQEAARQSEFNARYGLV